MALKEKTNDSVIKHIEIVKIIKSIIEFFMMITLILTLMTLNNSNNHAIKMPVRNYQLSLKSYI